MKFHYINILLFTLQLNVLVTLYNAHNQKPLYITPHIPTTRLLCECELYTSIYDDPQMKSVMENFNKQTEQRFHEYDERMIKKRQKCKEQCEKEIKHIILKDKMEKELKQQLATLETNIDNKDMPTCVCEKSLADKVEKKCLKCTQNLGGIVAPSSGVLGGIAELGLSVLKTAALAATKEAAIAEGTAEATKAGFHFGIQRIITELKNQLFINVLNSSPVQKAVTVEMLNNHTVLTELVKSHYKTLCITPDFNNEEAFCVAAGNEYSPAQNFIDMTISKMVEEAKGGADALTAQITTETIVKVTDTKTAMVEASFAPYNTAIIASVVAILIIVLVIVIIYLILRYRRKKKMKKKLQYIKLLNQ